ncbi:unnamed protein product [Didymodactylos carnosus]|uniref:Uncharacterized protein n=1 Tax=Didymodactylos carnosus TaxID=1234261 RepID=A0A814JHK4_9BILA|nr:unnamed protein product [Didymodactylos carnosus]CAF3806254.1 unnamed protein product [Didymodactylos carnosus]
MTYGHPSVDNQEKISQRSITNVYKNDSDLIINNWYSRDRDVKFGVQVEERLEMPRRIAAIRTDVKQDYYLIWLELSTDNRYDSTFKMVSKQLDSLFTTIIHFDDVIKCVHCVENWSKKQLFLILCGDLDETIMDYLNQMLQIEHVFVLCEKTLNEKSLKNDKITSTIYNTVGSMCEQIKIDYASTIKSDFRLSNIFNISIIEKLWYQLDDTELEFLQYQLLFGVLLHAPHKYAMKDLINHCSLLYNKSVDDLKKVDEFERTYRYEDAVKWYTKDSFIYRLLNKALRTEDITALYCFRGFLQDLNKNTQSGSLNESKILTTYRSQTMNVNEIEQLKEKIGSLVSINTFIITRFDREAACAFVRSHTTSVQTVLFEITINADVRTFLLSNTNQLVIMPGTMFQIESIVYDQDIWTIKLKSFDNCIIRDSILVRSLKTEFDNKSSLFVLGQIFVHMNKTEKALSYYQILLKDQSLNNTSIVQCLTEIGNIYNTFQEYLTALSYHEKALKVIENDVNILNSTIEATLHNNFALVYENMREYEKAFGHLSYSVKLLKRCRTTEYSKKLYAIVFNRIGVLHTSMKRFAEASLYHHESLEVLKNCNMSDQSLIAVNYNNIGIAFQNQNLHVQALNSHFKALQILSKPSSNNRYLASCYNHLGVVYSRIGQQTTAQSYFEAAVESAESLRPRNELSVAASYHHLGIVKAISGHVAAAFEYFEKALQVYRRSHKYDDKLLVSIYNNIAKIHRNQGDIDEALISYEKSLQLQLICNPFDASLLIETYKEIGCLNIQKQNYSNAAENFVQAFLRSQQSKLCTADSINAWASAALNTTLCDDVKQLMFKSLKVM